MSASVATPYPPTRRFFTVKEVAEMTALDQSTVYLLVKRGDIAGVRFGSLIRIPAREVIRLLGEPIFN